MTRVLVARLPDWEADAAFLAPFDIARLRATGLVAGPPPQRHGDAAGFEDLDIGGDEVERVEDRFEGGGVGLPVGEARDEDAGHARLRRGTTPGCSPP